MKIQINDDIVEANEEQIAFVELIRSQPKIDEEIAEQELLKQSAKTKLLALGLTEEEIAAL